VDFVKAWDTTTTAKRHEAKIRATAYTPVGHFTTARTSIARQRPRLLGSLDRLKFSCKSNLEKARMSPDLLLFPFFNEILPIRILIVYYSPTTIIIIIIIIIIMHMHGYGYANCNFSTHYLPRHTRCYSVLYMFYYGARLHLRNARAYDIPFTNHARHGTETLSSPPSTLMRDILALQAVWACRACQPAPPAKSISLSLMLTAYSAFKKESGEISKPGRIGHFRATPSPFQPRPFSILLFPIPAE
jgi:hypothetical protein